MVEKNDVIQVTGYPEWEGCLCQVDEVKNWGVVAWVHVPCQGNAFIRLNHDQYGYIGKAVMVPMDGNDEK